MVNAPAVHPSAPIEHDQPKKQKQKSKPTDDRPDSTRKEKKRKKKQHEDTGVPEAGATEATQVTDENVERPTKKKKNGDEEEISATGEQPTTGSEGASPKKPKREKRPKKPKDKSKGRREEAPNPKNTIQIVDVPVPYTNPLTDETLPDFAQRGLAYAYQYAQHVSLTSKSERAAKRPWKFNKARQNWILRNITDPTVIPDPYLTISLIYVTNIQGGARDELKKTCKTTKKQAKASKALPPNEQTESKSEKDQSPEAKDGPAKKVTFAAGAVESVTTESEASAPSKVKAKRAKTILKVLKGKVQLQDI
ncbi:unnamed protein product [Rhizoctonia solani]|uniref:WKF domain-containing protein n=1 Tax=Rhizoctonia solani TaxID=456999 RepID=A0A8H3HKL2_9AGAM|nr:unnamed protein product [Rhizoctonia solani]